MVLVLLVFFPSFRQVEFNCGESCSGNWKGLFSHLMMEEVIGSNKEEKEEMSL